MIPHACIGLGVVFALGLALTESAGAACTEGSEANVVKRSARQEMRCD
jgi:hypothetical protein